MEMNSPPFTLRVDGSDFKAFDLSNSNPVLHITPKPWESDFFNRTFGHLSLNENQLKLADLKAQDRLWRRALKFADQLPYDLIELTLDIKGFDMAPTCEDLGFRLVDSKVSFLTPITKSAVQRFDVKNGRIDLAEPKDMDAIISLTNNAFVENQHFFSRFKNPRYFSHQESKAYYAAWITNHYNDPKCVFAVWRHQGQCIGYYFYRQQGTLEGLPIYKGMLAAVDRGFQNQKAHVAMQTYLFARFTDPVFYVDNTTQLSNFPVIKNHVTSQRKLKNIELVFYRKRPEAVA